MNRAGIFKSGGALSMTVLMIVALAAIVFGISRDAPLGRIEGIAVMSESARPLAGATVILRPVRVGNEELPSIRSTKTDKNGKFEFRRVLAGEYTVESYSRVHKLRQAPVRVDEGKVAWLDLELRPNDPYLKLYTSQHVWTPKEQPQIQVNGFSTEPNVNISIYKLRPDAVRTSKSLYSLLSPIARRTPDMSLERANVESEHSLTHGISERDDEGVFMEDLQLPKLQEGIYWLQIDCGTQRQGTYLAISNIALVTKVAGTQTLAYVTDIESGKAKPLVPISVATGNTLLPVGQTDDRGVLEFKADKLSPGSESAVVAILGESIAVCTFSLYQPDRSGFVINYTTDRPVYRPGDEIHFKGTIRLQNGSSYRLPSGGSVHIKILDPTENQIESMELPLDAHGSFSSSFLTTREVVGSYQVVMTYNDREHRHYIQTQAYRKPEFKMIVRPEQPYFVQGDTIRMKAQCMYYFGGPVPNARLKAYIYRSPRWPGSDLSEEADGEDEDGGGYLGEFVDELREVTTDGQGIAYLEYRPKPDEEGPQFTDYSYTFMVFGSETGDKFFEGSGKALLVRGEFGILTEPDRYVCEPGDNVKYTIKTISNLEQTPVAGVDLTVEHGFTDWQNGEERFIREGVSVIKTDSKGRAVLNLKASGEGMLTVRVIGRDSRRNEIVDQNMIYVVSPGGGWAPEGPTPELSVTLDKSTYKAGDTATALIRTDRPGGSALITLESDKIDQPQVVDLQGKITTVKFEVKADYLPSTELMVTYVLRKGMAQSSIKLNVDTSPKKIMVSVTPEAASYQPGQTATYMIKTQTPDGEPVSSDVAFGVVDEAVYAIREDRTDPIKIFYPVQYNQVSTYYSFPEIYLDGGDKSPVDSDLRQSFQDTAFWNPSVHTDASGVARVDVKLPDNLTSWRATATAITDDTRCGKSVAMVKVRKPLMARLSAPTYIVENDLVRVSAVITNSTGRDIEAKVELASENLTIEGGAEQNVRVRADRPSTVEWYVRALKYDQASLTVWARAGALKDGMKLPVVISTHGRAVRDIQSGQVSAGAVNLRVQRLPRSSEGSIELTLTPTLASSILAGLDDLVDYPYGCTEQTMSRFMPAVVVSKAMRELGLPAPKLSRKITEVVSQSLGRLNNLQHYDGGWGWFEEDASEPAMTALVLEGLARCKDAGLPINPFMLDRALQYAREQFESPQKTKVRLDDLVYLASAASMHVRDAGAIRVLEAARWESLEPATIAHGILAYERLRGIEPAERYVQQKRRLLSLLLSKANVQAMMASWPEAWGVEQTAKALDAIITVAPDHPLLPKVVRYLLIARRGNSWTSTRDTAATLVGLTKYLVYTKELAPSYTLRVLLDGREQRVIVVDKESITKPAEKLSIPIRSLSEGVHDISLVIEGQGTCYYSLLSHQVPSQKTIGTLLNNSGLSVDRTFHSLEVERMEDGSLRLQSKEKPEFSFRSGQPVRCRLKIKAEQEMEFVIIEAPTPAGFHVSERQNAEVWGWWYSGIDILDDKVAFFARRLKAGESIIEYNLMAETPGKVSGLPVMTYQMYAPQIRGASGSAALEVRR